MGTFIRRLQALFRRNRLDDELAEEIRNHIEHRRRSLVDDGMAPEQAAYEARRQFGNVGLVRERAREHWGGSLIDSILQDLRYGLRLIVKAPMFTMVAISSLALGIGASAILFGLASSFMFRPIHAANAGQIVQLFTSNRDGSLYGGSSYADYEMYRDAGVFSGLLASMRTTATLSDLERPETVDGLLVSGNYFDVLGLRPSLGRFFRPEENQVPGRNPVVVLSDDAWRRRFGADPAIVGRPIELSGTVLTVIGIAPPRFAGTSVENVAEFFAPAMMQSALATDEDLLKNQNARVATVLGRLGAGVTHERADAAFRVLAARLASAEPKAWLDANGHARVVSVLPELDARFVGAPRGTALAIISSLTATVTILLAIACVNVATVLLARASVRRKEIAVRLAMGASRRRLIRQMLTECTLIAAAAGTLGLAITQAAAALFTRFRPDGVPAFDLTIDARILLFSVGASMLTVFFFGLAPALQSTRPDVNAELKGAGRTVRVGRRRFNLRAGLVVVQVATSLALVAGAALMFRSARAALTIDPGFRRDQVVNVGIDLSTVPDRDGAHLRLFQEAVRTVAALPGVERASLAALVPLDGSNMQARFRIVDGTKADTIIPDINMVSSGYFALLDIPVRQGREFTAADISAAPGVAVVNESMAREYWNGAAIGHTVIDDDTNAPLRIVGVVRDVRHRSFGEAPRPMLYLSASQFARRRMTLHVRSAVPPGELAQAVQRSLRNLDRAAGFGAAETMDEYLARMTMEQRLGAAGAIAMGALELALAVMAIYGVIAFAASERRREIGLRLALGASGRDVVSMLMRDGLVLAGSGVVVGLGIAIAGGVALESELIGVSSMDPVSLFGPAVLLVVVAAVASYIPARRALTVDPSTVLKSE
jgi:predicted permease